MLIGLVLLSMTGAIFALFHWPALLAMMAAGLAMRQPSSPWRQPIEQSWPAVNQWNRGLEDEYVAFVARLGQAVAQRRCRRLDVCLRDPESNLLFEAAIDPALNLEVDCGDLPYVLRGYFSWKRRLPFGFVCDVRGEGQDARYLSNLTPRRWCSFRDYDSPRAVLRAMTNEVHSGMYRMAPEVEGSDFYPLAINRHALRPGAVYYDPNGHVLVVGEVRADGTVYLMDGHPDGTLSWKRFGQAFALGGRSQGGGFKYFRTLRLVDDQLVRAKNLALPDFDGQSQWDRSLRVIDQRGVSYYEWVRSRLADSSTPVDPVADFREQLRAICRDVSDRVEAVELATSARVHKKSHPGELPWNIYGTDGEWEVHATPSRDARLKAAFRELYESVAALPDDESLRERLRAEWTQAVRQSECVFTYVDSLDRPVKLALGDVLDRLFRLSFDPYHCPELRWGAPDGSPEAASCPDDASKRALFQAEQQLRNRIDRDYGAPTPLTSGPESAPDLDVRHLLFPKR